MKISVFSERMRRDSNPQRWLAAAVFKTVSLADSVHIQNNRYVNVDFARQHCRCYFCTITLMMGSEGFGPSPVGLKDRYATITPRTQWLRG